MKFSICIPNFNYENYLGRTVESVRAQTDPDWEVLFSDNASPDKSVEVVRQLNDPRIHIRVNACNVGFSGNLDRAGRMAQGEFMIMLSSDDLMRPNALAVYRKLLDALGEQASQSLLCAACDVIDANDQKTGEWRLPTNQVWREADRVPELEQKIGAPVYRVAGDELLRRCLLNLQNPFYFLAACYPRALYESVEGYGGGRLYSPDKWFHWRLLSKAKFAYFIDQPLFAYRWHATNQNALQNANGILKEQIDEYVNTFEIDGKLLERIGLQRDQFIDAYIEHGIARRGLACLGRGQRVRARQIHTLGKSLYPNHLPKNKKARALGLLLALGPVGDWIARRYFRKYKEQQNSRTQEYN